MGVVWIEGGEGSSSSRGVGCIGGPKTIESGRNGNCTCGLEYIDGLGSR